MATPSAVKRQAAEAKKLHEDLYNKPEDADANENDPPAAEPAAEPEPAEAEKPQPAAEAPKPAEPAPAPKPEIEVWQARYKTLEGKYNAEVPRLSSELRRLQEEIEDLRSRPEPEPVQPVSKPAEKPLVTPEEIDEYGDDFVDFIRRAAREAVAAEVEKLTPRLNKLEAGFTKTTQQTAQQRVHAALDSQVENWRQINRDPLFGEWLRDIELASGQDRYTLMNEAYSKGEADRVVYFFREYLKTLPPTGATPQTNVGAEQQPANPAPERSGMSLEDFAGPTQRHPGAVNAPERPKHFSRAEIQAFYSDVRQGRYRNRADEKNRKEAEFIRAAAEGRVSE